MADSKQFVTFNPPVRDGPASQVATEAAQQERVDQLIRTYRVRGHINARLDPLDRVRAAPPVLESEFYGFTEADMERRFGCATMQPGGLLTLREILERLRQTYCRSIG